MTLRTYNDALVATYPTYVVGTAENLRYLDPAPFGLALHWRVDPTRTQSGTFLDLLQRLDVLTFGPKRMPMDKWVFYNCAELPGFIYGFAAPAAELASPERAIFGLPDGYDGPVPLSMYIAIPMREPGYWFGHNLASLGRTLRDRELGYLGTITKALALKAFRTKHFFGATQWTSHALYIHTKFGPLDLLSAWTPVHTIPETLTYGFTVTDDVLLAAAGDPAVHLARSEPDFYLDAEDTEGMRALQAKIEAGMRLVLTGRPLLQAERLVHPIGIKPNWGERA